MKNLLPNKLTITFISWRYYLLILFILLAIAGLVTRIVYLTVVDRHFLQTQGNARALRIVKEPPFRGMITDRDGYPFAISTSVYSIWINPKEFSPDKKSIQALSKLLAVKPAAIQKLIENNKNKNREFAYLKREVAPPIAEQVKALKIAGVYLQQDYKRFYPEGEIISQVIGFTNVDDQGQEGLELAYNQWLTGVPGKKLVLKDRRGRVISEVRSLQNQQAGKDLTLSIDRRIQYLAYRELMKGVQDNIAQSGSVIVLDIKTGEVLAMVNQPSFNPNNISSQPRDHLRNRAITDIFEPGSTIKTFSLVTALQSGKYKPDTMIDTYPGWMRVDHHVVRDEHMKGELSVAQILQVSSNVGITKIMLTLPPEQLWDVLHRVGFGEATDIGFPGEQAGKLIKRPTWKPFALATLSFGYGLSTTALQLARAYAIIGNDGQKIPLSLLRVEQPPEGKRVINSKLSKEMLQLLETVVTEKGATGEPARIPGYRVAGKTGTSHMVGANGYEKKRYISSFVGIAPVSNPRLVVAVVIYEPTGKQYYGGQVSGPVFQKIMAGALRTLNISPDDPAALPQGAEL